MSEKEKVVVRIEIEPMVDFVKKGGTTGAAVSCNVRLTSNLKEADRNMSDMTILLSAIHALLSRFMDKKGIKITKEKQDAITDVLNSIFNNILGKTGSCVAKSGSLTGADKKEVISEIKKSIEEIKAGNLSNYVDNEDDIIAKDMDKVTKEIKPLSEIMDTTSRNKVAENFAKKIKGYEPEFIGVLVMALAVVKHENSKAYNIIKSAIEHYLA